MSQLEGKRGKRRTRKGAALFLFHVLIVLSLIPRTSLGQEAHYSVSLQGITLDTALRYLARQTSLSLVYSSDLVQRYSVDCVLEDQPIETILSCVLKNSPLDFVQLSSGMYVIKEKREMEPRYGYFSGTVLDKEHQAPIPDAHVIISNRTDTYGTTTNASGQFIFPRLVAGQYAIEASHVSYTPWKDSLTVIAELHVTDAIDLEMESVQIAPIVIDGLYNRPLGAQLDHEEIDAHTGAGRDATAPAASLFKRAGTLVGVRISDATADIHLQGAETGAHQFRLNGAPLFLPRSSIGIINPLGTFPLSRIRIHKAGFGASVGSQTAGVIQGEYNLEMVNRLESQVDLNSLNLKVQRKIQLSNTASAAILVSARTGLWDLYTPPQLRSTLSNWATPDPFVLFAPMREYTFITQDVFEPDSSEQTVTDLSLNYADVHAAARLHFNEGHSLIASYYEGGSTLNNGAPNLDEFGDLFPDGFSTQDRYRWRYNAAQIRYNKVLSGNSLLSAQVRHSRTRSGHHYTLSYGFDNYEFYREDDDSLENIDLFRDFVHDEHMIREIGGELTLDYAYSKHHLQIGVEAAATRSAFNLLLANMDEYFYLSDYGGIEDGTERPNLPERDTTFIYIDRIINENSTRVQRAAFFAEQRIVLHSRWQTTLGIRATSLHGTVYQEPRFSLRYDTARPDGRAFAAKFSAGIYRQFINQVDISVLNAGELLPSTRIWLPVDKTVTPAEVSTLSLATAWKPHKAWEIRSEAYVSLQNNNLAIKYSRSIDTDSLYAAFSNQPLPKNQDQIFTPTVTLEQRQFMTPVKTNKHGFNTSLAWTGAVTKIEAQYSYSYIERTSKALFNGRPHPAPWNEPHRVDLLLTLTPSPAITVTLKSNGVWGRKWGFRRAYYDYFGHTDDLRQHGDFDLGNPSQHALPPLYEVDVGIAYTQTDRDRLFQVRFDVLNVLNRKNVIDWRLLYDENQQKLVIQPRYLYGFMPMVSVRYRF